MAVISALPQESLIRELRGVLDYACWRGVYYVRSWPRPPALPRAAAVLETAATFADLSKRLSSTHPQAIARADTRGVPLWTWKDLFTSSAYNHTIQW